MANSVVVATRRDRVRELWLRGWGAGRIAGELGMTLGTAKHDVYYVRQDILAHHHEDLTIARGKIMLSVEAVIDRLWSRYDALASKEELGAEDERLIGSYLAALIKAEALLARLTGAVSAPAYAVTYWLNKPLSEAHVRQLAREREREAREVLGGYEDLDDDEGGGDDGGGDDGATAAEDLAAALEALQRRRD